jgi:hypothetical protein
MVDLYGSVDSYLLFTDGSNAVVVDTTTNMVDEVGLFGDLAVLQPWDRGRLSARKMQKVHLELAEAALSDLSVQTITASARLYTIPKSVQEEAKRALKWRKEHKRGGTPVGLNTARTLANGGQIGISKIRHIAKYFPRHEVDKKAKGYKPGQPGFPSNGRIAWALWGGDAAWKWSRQIVEREDKKAIKADAWSEGKTRLGDYDANIDAFQFAKMHEGLDNAPEFAVRVRLDGTGIDRLYMIDPGGLVYVWDDGLWDNLGHVDSDIFTYDKSLDDPYDKVEKHHMLVDSETAFVVSAHLQQKPFCSVALDDLDEEELHLVTAAASEIDWVMVDAAMVAAGETAEYTPEERAANARRQVRDATGKFSKMGSRVQIGNDSSAVGNIVRINPANKSVTVRMVDGTSKEVPASQTKVVSGTRVPSSSPAPPGGDSSGPIGDSDGVQREQPTQPLTSQPRLDTSGILAQPRAPIDRPNAYIPGGLPALRPQDLQQIIRDFPAWVMSERQQSPGASSPASEDLDEPRFRILPIRQGHPAGDRAGTPPKSDYLKNLEKETGTSLYTGKGYDHPLLQNFFSKPKNRLYYSPITSSADEKTEGLGQSLSPDTSDVKPMYFAIVSPDDPAAVMDLASVVPASTKSTSPVTFKRVDGEWVRDDQILADMTSATPPPVVPLSDEVYEDVLEQVDQTMTASGLWSYQFTELNAKLIDLYLAESNPLTAAGGVDRNRGNAEKLRRYWLFGRGALKIRWNTPGDWTRCYRNLKKYMGPRAKGYCSLRHKEATGTWPGSRFNVGKKKKGIRGGALDNFDIASETQVLEHMRIRAAIADAKQRVVTAAAGEIEIKAPGAKFFIPIVIPEDTETGDGRIFKKGSITTRELPLPLLWQIKTDEGHTGSVVVGRIDTMDRVEDGIGNAHGVFDSGPYGREVERMVREGFIRGVSADLDKFEASEDDDIDDDDTLKSSNKSKKKIGGDKIVVDKARVMAVTIVPKPAFEQCKIYIDDESLTADSSPQEDVMNYVPDGVYTESVDDLDAEALVACGMIASSIPVVPPAGWFENPKLSKPTPLTVDDEGRVYGHIAAWSQDHIGMSYGTKPPRSRSKYAYFHTGVVRADDGKDYPVGQLTLAGGHASLEASAADAAKHYDDTGSAIADVHAGEDAYGIWVAGALRSSASPEQIRALRASAPSGDWRPINGSLELVAVCQVNVPGFPVARARVASGQVYALIAAGAMSLAKMKSDPIRELNSRLDELEKKTGVSSTATELAQMAQSARERMNEFRGEKAADLSAKAVELASRMRSSIPYDELGYISKSTREKLAKQGRALPDGSYPIRNVEELKDAIQAYGRSKPGKRAAVRRHIMKRARALGKADLIPEKWKSTGLIDDDAVESLKARVASASAKIVEKSSAKEQADSLIEALTAAGTIVPEEQELADALVAIAEKYGKFNDDDTGVWAGYESASENENAEFGVSCSNCILYEGGTSCKIIAAEVEPMGYCRFAVIPDGIVSRRKV